MLLLVQTAPDEWSPGIGDPTVIGWVTVVAYVVAFLMCVRAWRTAAAINEKNRLTIAWGVLTALMLFLGINKQLDLQSLLTVVARRAALRGGWYPRRRPVQLGFIGAMLVAGAGALTVGGWLMRRHLREFWLAGIGAVFIVVFVLVRASSFHHVDTFLRSGPPNLHFNAILELGGIGCIGYAAYQYASRASRPERRRLP
jgi:hypothetical protein